MLAIAELLACVQNQTSAKEVTSRLEYDLKRNITRLSSQAFDINWGNVLGELRLQSSSNEKCGFFIIALL